MNRLTFDQYAGPFLDAIRARDAPPYFFTYYRNVVADPGRLRGHFGDLENAYRRLHGDGATLLDAGCGFGHNALWAAMLGAAKVHAVDMDPEKIETLKRLSVRFGVADRIEARLGTVFPMPYPDDSFDGVYSFECLEHFEDLERFSSETFRVLRPGGRTYSRTGCNALSPVNRIVRKRFHDRLERERFIPRRREMLAQHFPDLDRGSIERLAVATRGLARERILSAARDSLERRRPLEYSRWSPAVDPETGQWAERPINPYSLAATMRRQGFAARVLRSRFHIAGKGWKRKVLNAFGVAVTLLHPASIVLSPSIEVYGEKPARRDDRP